MIARQSMLSIVDNSGAKKAMCIGILGPNRTHASVGDIIICAVKDVIPNPNIKKGDKVKVVIVRTNRNIRRKDGTYIKFDDNCGVVIDDDKNPKGSRIFGPVARELRAKNFMKIVSLAPEVW